MVAADSKQNSEDNDWEREYAPRVTRRQLACGVVVFGLWLAFLAYFAASRWLGSLQ